MYSFKFLLLLLPLHHLFAIQADHDVSSGSSPSTYQKSSRRILQDDKKAIAYLCDEDDVEIESDDPLQFGDDLRICVERGPYSQRNNLYISKINEFEFSRSVDGVELILRAFDSGAAVDDESGGLSRLEYCPNGGTELCSFSTRLPARYFESDGTIQGVGTVVMQSGKDGNGNRRVLIETISLRGGEKYSENDRLLQDNDDRGIANVSIEFAVGDGDSSNNVKNASKKFKNHWNESPSHVQALYIVALLVVFFFCFCACAACILWKHCCVDIVEKTFGDHGPRMIFVHKTEKDISETRSVDDDDNDGDDYDYGDRQNSAVNNNTKMLKYDDSSRRSSYDDANSRRSSKRSSSINPNETTMVPYDDRSRQSSRKSRR